MLVYQLRTGAIWDFDHLREEEGEDGSGVFHLSSFLRSCQSCVKDQGISEVGRESSQLSS